MTERDVEGPPAREDEQTDGVASLDATGQLTPGRRVGYGVTGLGLTAMGFWIFPYQLERGDFFATLTGATLAVLGVLVVAAALRGGGGVLKRLERLVELISELAGA